MTVEDSQPIDGNKYHKVIALALKVKNLVDGSPYLTLALFGMFVALPLLILGLPLMGDDTLYHGLYYKNFSEQLWSGEMYPRWLYKINAGFGGPTMFYYPPAAYYITSIFWLLPLAPLHQLGLGSALAIVLAGWSARLWLRQLTTSGVATAAAALYMLLPYPVAHDAYSRGAVAELFTFIWMPLILYFVVRISRGDRLAPIGLAVSYGLLCTTHLPTTLMFSIVPVLYSVLQAYGAKRLKVLATTVASMALGVGLAAVYILPAMAYQDYVFMNEMREGPFWFGGYLIGWQLDLFGNMKYFWMVLDLGLVCVVSYLIAVFSLKGKDRREINFWGAIAVAAIFMTLGISKPIWEAIPVLQKVQFPWRFNTVASVASLPLIALCISLIRGSSKWASGFAIVVTVYCVVSWTGQMVRVERDALFKPPEWWRPGQAERMNMLGLDWHALWPKTVPFTEPDLDINVATIPVVGSERARAFVRDGNGQVSVVSWYPREVELQTNTESEATVVVSQFYFPGWKAHIAGSNVALPVIPTPDLGLVSINVPPGVRYVKLTLVEMWPELIGEWLSALCALLTLGLFGRLVYLRKRPPPTAE